MSHFCSLIYDVIIKKLTLYRWVEIMVQRFLAISRRSYIRTQKVDSWPKTLKFFYNYFSTLHVPLELVIEIEITPKPLQHSSNPYFVGILGSSPVVEFRLKHFEVADF